MTEPTVLHPQALAPQSATHKLLNMIERVARDTSVDMNVLERLMAMRERVVADERRMSFNEAVGKAKSKMPEIKKNNVVNLGNNRSYAYEDLAQIERTIKDTLGEFGLSYRFRTDSVSKPGVVVVTCILSHRDGHSEENSLSAANDTSGAKNAIQALGSSVTYLERYTLKAALGLAASVDDDDDDGAAAAKVEVISDEQALEIANLIAETKTNIVVFLEYVKAPSVSDIPAKEFDRIVGLLKRKKGTP
jgi:hypothetical protein